MKDATIGNPKKVLDVFRPPNEPWLELISPQDAGACVSIYYSDDLSPLAVRAITRPGDNKSDPNLETLTYGLFSTCGRALRAGMVKRGDRFLFFATKRGKTRVLSGYYDIGWYAESISAAELDFCLAARSARFLREPIPLSEVDRQCGTNISNPFRGFRKVGAKEAIAIKQLIDKGEDATQQYLAEIDRLERFNLYHAGYRYIGWHQKDSFSWSMANKYLAVPTKAAPKQKTVNSSPTGLWRCKDCEKVSANKSLLRRCPLCGKVAVLEPVDELGATET